MKVTLLLNHNDDFEQIEEEEKSKFLKEILIQIGLPVEEFWTSDKPLSVKERIKLREILSAYNILVVDDLDGHMQIFVENDLIGEWNKCSYKLKRDLRQIDPKKRLFMEMAIDAWSVFEKENEKE